MQEIENQSSSPQDHQQDIIREGEEAKAAVLQYTDWLITTCNECIPGDLWSFPEPHPCAVPHNQIQDSDGDNHDLVNSVQQHTECSAAYCLRQKPGQEELQCHFEYSCSKQSTSTLTFERLQDNTIRATVTTKRNDPHLNSHNCVLLQNW